MAREATPETHDLMNANLSFTPIDGGQEGLVACWDERKPQPGDYLILRNGHRGTRYRVVTMDPCMNVDPPTMWTAKVAFAPRPSLG